MSHFKRIERFKILILISAVFQAGGLVVVLVEVVRKNFLASMVPVVVNAILNAHQLVVDIVAFVSRGDFPRSRLGEKQRGKILASWVTRKMRTIAQFGIKDPDGPDAETGLPRRSAHSMRSGSVRGGSSLKHVESTTGLADLQEREQQPTFPFGGPAGPSADDNSIMESPPAPVMEDDNETERYDDSHRNFARSQKAAMTDYSAVELPTDEFNFGDIGPSRQEGALTKGRPSDTPQLSLPLGDGHGSFMTDDFSNYRHR